MPFFRRLTLLVALTFAVGTISACTCNKAGTSRKARPKKNQMLKKGKMQKAKMSKMKRKKVRNRAAVNKVEVSIFLLDQAKFDAGKEDPWVEVKRSVGGRAPARNAVWTLFKGPNEDEKSKGLTFLNNDATGFQGFIIEGDTATLQLREGCSNQGGTVSVYDHLSKTLKGFPEIKHVRVVGPNDSVPSTPGDHRPACLQP